MHTVCILSKYPSPHGHVLLIMEKSLRNVPLILHDVQEFENF